MESKQESPSKIWWVGHVFFWIITGLICYVIWKDKNEAAAKKHLVHSIWIGIAPIGLVFLAAIMVGIFSP